MTFTYDLSTSLGKLRLRIPDDDATSYVFEDAELSSYLTQSGGSVDLALLYLYSTLCSQSNASSGDEIRVGDIRVNSAKSRGANYCALAKQQMEFINMGFATDALGVGETTGLYQADRDTNRENKNDGLIVDRGFNEDSFDNTYLNIETGTLDEE